MDFEKKYPLDADSTIADWGLDSNPGIIAASESVDPSTREKIKEEIRRKEKLVDHIDGYLVKNISETAKLPDEEIRNGDAQYEVLKKGYGKWSSEEEQIKERIAELRETIGEKGTDTVLPPESRRNPVVEPSDDPVITESSGFFGKLAKRLLSPYETIRSWFRNDKSDGNVGKEIPAGEHNDGIYADLGENSFPMKSSKEDIRPIEASREPKEFDPPVSIPKDLYEHERYVRGASESVPVEPIEPDESLLGNVSEKTEKERMSKLRSRDAMGFSAASSSSGPEAVSGGSKEEPLSWKFGMDPDMSYEVEELSAEDMVRKAEELGAVYAEILEDSRSHPRLRESYEMQSEIAKESYVDALGVARLTLAAELRGEPEGNKRKELMTAFASVVSKLRALEDAPEERERKAA